MEADDGWESEHSMATYDELLRLAHHYQDLARRQPEEERFWFARALFFGRMASRARR
jgi:hypothetical protein